MPHNHKVFIETVGCQMNLLDSELVIGALRKRGYALTHDVREADTVLFNTCSVREHAEEKIYSALGRLKQAKRQRPQLVIGVLGCMAQKDQKRVFRRAPHVDVVCGPGQLSRLPELIEEARAHRRDAGATEGGSSHRRDAGATEGGGSHRRDAGATDVVEGSRLLAVSMGRKDGAQREIARSFESYDPLREPALRPSPHQAYVRVMIGCDKFCTYCIVPAVRGPEQSRHPAQIEAEVKKLADEGCREVTLLGQTVNSYKFDENGPLVTLSPPGGGTAEHSEGGGQDLGGPGHWRDASATHHRRRATDHRRDAGATGFRRTTRLSDLLYRIHDTPGLARIKFITNFPNDMTDDLLQAVRDLPKVCPYLHVPAQSGCNEVLARMKRLYTVEQYREMLARARETVPGVAVSSDFIVGFCGETEASFQRTCDLVREARFKNSFIFKYSPRPGTKAHERMPDDVPEDVKRRRNNELLAIQNAISLEDNREFVGQTVEVLVEGPSRLAATRDAETRGRGDAEKFENRGPNSPSPIRPLAHSLTRPQQLTGRTHCDRIVVFQGNDRLIGNLVRVKIEAASAVTLFGSVVTYERRGALLPVVA